MKTRNRIEKATLTMGLLAVVVLMLSACGNTGNAQNTKEATEESKPKAPSIDIHTAVFMANIKAVQQHINAGTDLNQKDAYGSTPLNIAATFGRAEIAQVLIKGGANLSETSADGSTALHTAAFLCRTEIVKSLLAAGADKTLRNSYGSTPLEAVSAPFEMVKPAYEQMNKDLGPFGLKLDYTELEETRPVVAEMLK
ncbi:MAG TPA: ankyrin repeat domain-containing protein [Bacteroidales bacterium]|nr:ankyrin repeat domain-containing protein [Bacteroidales bacterium]